MSLNFDFKVAFHLGGADEGQFNSLPTKVNRKVILSQIVMNRAHYIQVSFEMKSDGMRKSFFGGKRKEKPH